MFSIKEYILAGVVLVGMSTLGYFWLSYDNLSDYKKEVELTYSQSKVIDDALKKLNVKEKLKVDERIKNEEVSKRCNADCDITIGGV